MKRNSAKKTSRPINVSLRVIADLSQGLYRTPADALKELVSNAYDADSPEVQVTFARDFSSITIRDWGNGLTVDEFIETMETIGASSKRYFGDKGETASGRKIIGRIGIGLLGVSQIANQLVVESTVQGERVGFRANIEFEQFASEEARKIKITDLWEGKKSIEIGRYYFEEVRGIDKAKHFTTLKLRRLKRTILERLRTKSDKNAQPRMLGKRLGSTLDLIQWMEKKGITKSGLHEYDRIFWELCTLCPVPYLKKALKIFNRVQLSSTTRDFTKFATEVNSEIHLKLTVDGIQCFKPILMPSVRETKYPLFFNLLYMDGLDNRVVSYNDYDPGGNLVEKTMRVRGYMYFQRPKVWPPELQGLIIRVRHVGVGQHDSTFLTYRRHEAFKFSQITGEILVDDLDDALNIDRSSFRESDPPFVAIRDAIHGYLNKVVFPGIKSYATDERTARREAESRQEKNLLQKRFKSIDKRKRRIVFSQDQPKLVKRSPAKVSLASDVGEKHRKAREEFYRIVAFLEAYLHDELGIRNRERDGLFEELCRWLKRFE